MPKVQPKLYHLTEPLKDYEIHKGETMGEFIERVGWTVAVDRAFEAYSPGWMEFKLEAKRTNSALGQKGNVNRLGKPRQYPNK